MARLVQRAVRLFEEKRVLSSRLRLPRRVSSATAAEVLAVPSAPGPSRCCRPEDH